MARIVEDSDDEFPDISDLLILSKPVLDQNLQSSSSNPRGIKSRGLTVCLYDPNVAEKSIERGAQGSKKSEMGNAGTGAKKAKIRVLKQTNELSRNSSSDAHKVNLASRSRVLGFKVTGSVPRKRAQESGANGRSDEEAMEPKRSDTESDRLSDFVVDDDDEQGEEDAVIQIPPPRSVRRLVRGRRPQVDEDDELFRLKKDELTMKAQDKMEGSEDPKSNNIYSSRALEEKGILHRTPSSRGHSRRKGDDPGPTNIDSNSDWDDPFILKFCPSPNKPRNVAKQTRLKTPPASPEPVFKSRGLVSPQKVKHIPLTPHIQSMDSFWNQDVINNWNDEFSPRKTSKPPGKLLFTKGSSTLSSSKKGITKQDQITRDAKKSFTQGKHQLAESFLTELDNIVTDGQVSKLAASTGGVKIIWSKKLNTTAGRANWKRETIKSTSPGVDSKPVTTFRHHAAIELAEKVIDDNDRLLNVIAHEFCHLANFMISNIKTNPHGKEFKAWAAKCSQHFGDRGVEVTTKHSYAIDYKYVWECENCGLEFKRHSKSIDPARHQCGSCKSKLVQTKPVPRNGEGTVNEYQAFVKETMKKVREENPGSPQKEIMRLVGKRYQDYKATKLVVKKHEASMASIVNEEFVESKEDSSLDNDIGLVGRKLEFLDLTSS